MKKSILTSAILLAGILLHAQEELSSLFFTPSGKYPMLNLIPKVLHDNPDSLTVQVNIVSLDNNMDGTPIYTTTVSLSDTDYFQLEGSIVIDSTDSSGTTLYAYRFIYDAYSPVSNTLTLIELNTLYNGEYYDNTANVWSACHPYNRCPSRFFVKAINSFIKESFGYYEIYNEPFIELPTREKGVVKQAMNWMLNNDAATVSDYEEALDEESGFGVGLPGVFCTENSFDNTCGNQRELLDTLKKISADLVALGMENLDGLDSIGNKWAKYFSFNCVNEGNYLASMLTVMHDSGYLALFIPYHEGAPAVSTMVIFDNDTFYTATGYSYDYSDIFAFGYFSEGQISTHNGFVLAKLDSLYRPFPDTVKTITASGPIAFCEGDTVAVTLSCSPIGGHLLWSTSDTTTTIAVDTIGSYTLTVTDADGCKVKADTVITISTIPLPEPPTAPAPQSVASDTAYDFLFENIKAGYNAHQIEWALDSNFTTAYLDTPLCSIAFTVPLDSFQMFWLRSVDTATGCKSMARASIAISQNIYQRQPITVDSVITVCSGTAAAIRISGSDTTLRYVLFTDTGTVRTNFGNNSTLVLYTANITTPTFYYLQTIDTATHDTIALGDGILINPVGAVDTNVYIEGDTLVYVNDSALYNASAMYGIKAIYSLHSGSATVDSLTGYVYNISGNKFTLRATLYGAPGCGSVTDTLRVRVTDVGIPTAPPPVTVYLDSPTQLKAIIFSSITAGTNGTEIEWATNDTFANSTIVAAPATISITLNGIADTTIWLRSIDNRTGRHSRSVNTRARSALPFLSAGLLDKSRWTLDEDKSDEFDWPELLPQNNNNSSQPSLNFENKWNLIYMWGGGKAGATDISNAELYTLPNNTPRGETQLFDWGMCPYNSSPCGEPGCAGEVYFEDGIMHMKAERFPNAPIIETVNTDGGSFDAPFYYHSGLLSSVEMFPLVNSMWEIRWKLPQEADGYSAFPTFWNYRGGTNFTIVDGGSTNRVNGNVDDPLGSCGIETNKLTECGYTDDWHTFTAVTTETEIIYFIDGKEKWSNKFSVANAAQQNNPLTARWPTDIFTGSTAEVPIFINLQVYDWSCPSYWDDPTCVRQPPTWQTCELLVDYFRYYSPANPSNTQMLQNIQSGIAKTLESPVNDGTVITPANQTPPNHNVLPIANTINGTSHQVHWSEEMAYTNEQGLMKIYYSGTDAPLSTFFKCYNAYYDNGNWYDYALVDWVTDVYGEITVDEDRVYYVTRNSGTTPKEIKFFQWMGNSWANFSTHCQGTSLNVDQFGRLWFIGLDDDIHLWTPNGGQITGGLTDITSDGLEKRGLSVHPSGILFFYTDDNNDMKQVLWNFPNTWVNYGTVASGVMPHSMTQDEVNTRVYFIGDDKDVHYYSLNLAGTGITKKLGNACEQYDNANWEWYAPVLSHDKKMVFYQSDDDEIWYYFNDQDANNRENWYRTPLQYGTKNLGHFAIEPWNFGRLFYVNNAPNSSIDCLHYVDWVNADNSVDCPMTSNPQQTAFYKTDETGNNTQEKVQPMNKTQNPAGLRVFPNPSTGSFEFSMIDSGVDFSMEIIDIHSSVIESKKCDDLNRCVWNAENIPNGIYFYKVKSSTGKIFTGKLIKIQ